MNHLTQAQAAEIAGMSARRLRQLEQEGAGPPREAGAYPPRQFGRWLLARNAVAAGRLDANQEKARLDAARASLAELELAARRGELVEVTAVTALWVDEVARLRSRLLHLPSRVAPTLVGVEDLRVAEHALRDALIETLGAISAVDGTPQ